jgi:hypothetical protein
MMVERPSGDREASYRKSRFAEPARSTINRVPAGQRAVTDRATGVTILVQVSVKATVKVTGAATAGAFSC